MINIVFLCHEITKGMKSFGPKAMIPIGKKKNTEPLIVKQIKTIQKIYEHIPHTIYVVVGFEQDRIIKTLKACNIKANFIKYDNYAEDNSAGAVLKCLNEIQQGDYLFIENGIICSYKLRDYNKSTIPILKHKNKNERFTIGVTVSDNKAEYLFYDLANKWSETIFITEYDKRLIQNISADKIISHMFLFEYINLLIESQNITFSVQSIPNNKVIKILNHKVSNHVNMPT